MEEKYSPEVIEAVRGSKCKWVDIKAGKEVDNGGANCPLCKLFGGGIGCVGCPISDKTLVDGCSETPYGDWVSHQIWHNRIYPPFKSECPECEMIADEEIKFLDDLLQEITKEETK